MLESPVEWSLEGVRLAPNAIGFIPRIGGTLRADDAYETGPTETLRRVLVHDVRRRRGLVRRGGLRAWGVPLP
jgi:hypothetical protein